MPLQATSGAASYDAFGGGVPVVPNYIEDVFSTYLYTGTGSAQTITNGVDLSTKGGLVWVKNRSSAVQHFLFDTSRGMGFASQSPFLSTNLTDAQTDAGTNYIRADTTGFSYGSGASGSGVNAAPNNYASWTFRKQPKFFDVVTYTGSASAQNIAHNLGSTPACIIVKKTNDTSIWPVYHASLGGADKFLLLNATDAVDSAASLWNNTAPTSTQFTVGTSGSTNGSGNTFVAYLFAHNAGGFGLTGTDNVISCGTFTPSSGEATVNLGYEPQWILWKNADGAYGWFLLDNMRGIATGGDDQRLVANSSNAEGAAEVCSLTSTGFKAIGQVSGHNYVYIAIRKGPMKVPTSGTSVFTPTLATGGGSAIDPTYPSGFPVDAIIRSYKPGGYSFFPMAMDRLRGASPYLVTSSTAAEVADTGWRFDSMTGFYEPGGGPNSNVIGWMFRRAPSFFDEVCYTGTNPTAQNLNHNLGVVPELMIVKKRGGTQDWAVYATSLGTDKLISLNTDGTPSTSVNYWNDTAPTASVFSVGNSGFTNLNATTYVAYLFATCPGVSKVGSYTGTGTTLQVNCGFTAGARFVLIKRTDSTGDWYVWDTARGIVSGNDSYLLLNSTAAEVTNTDYIDTYSAGFEISSTAPAAINASGGSFIFFAVA
jgi:hypothetical protein